jgi:mono/diheme cytochrome c family protein
MCAAPPREGGLPAAPAPATPGSGKDLYRAHCASCHGVNGKGDGPVADSMRMRPTDLTLLSQNNGGKFPEFRLRKMLGGVDDLPAHGGKQMPVWGPLLTGASPNNARNSVVVRNLIAYLQSIQAKR